MPQNSVNALPLCTRTLHRHRAVASLTVPGGQEFHFLHFFLKFRSIFPQTLLIFFILALRVGELPTREGPGYATAQTLRRLHAAIDPRWHRTKGPFILHRNCVAVPICRLLSAASHRSITAFQVKMNLIFMRHRNAVTLQFMCSRVQYCTGCSTATQRNCGVVWTDL